MIQDGRYTVVYPDGQYRTVRVKTVTNGPLAGKAILSLKDGNEYSACGFLTDNDKVQFWKRFRYSNPPERLPRIQKAIDRIAVDPDGAGMAFALKENCCFRCGRELTVPASIHRGLGPECAKKRVTKKDNQAAYEWAKEGSAA